MAAALLIATDASGQNLSWEELSKQSWEMSKQGDFQTAMTVAKKALDAATSQYGPRHANVLISLNTIAGLYKSNQQYRAAEPFLKKALAVRTLSISDPIIKQDYIDIYAALKNLYNIYKIHNAQY